MPPVSNPLLTHTVDETEHRTNLLSGLEAAGPNQSGWLLATPFAGSPPPPFLTRQFFHIEIYSVA